MILSVKEKCTGKSDEEKYEISWASAIRRKMNLVGPPPTRKKPAKKEFVTRLNTSNLTSMKKIFKIKTA